MSHKEHPGPEAPSTKNQSSSQSSSKSDSSSEGKGRPAIHHPQSAAEKDDPEVKKHNEEMRQRSDQTANQLSEEENKVDPKFWKGEYIWDHLRGLLTDQGMSATLRRVTMLEIP
jgi:hypothetical protein